MKEESGQNLQEEDSAKESEKEYLEMEEPESSRECSLLATLGDTDIYPYHHKSFTCPLPISLQGIDIVKQNLHCYFLKVYYLGQGIQMCTSNLKYRLLNYKFRG